MSDQKVLSYAASSLAQLAPNADPRALSSGVRVYDTGTGTADTASTDVRYSFLQKSEPHSAPCMGSRYTRHKMTADLNVLRGGVMKTWYRYWLKFMFCLSGVPSRNHAKYFCKISTFKTKSDGWVIKLHLFLNDDANLPWLV